MNAIARWTPIVLFAALNTSPALSDDQAGVAEKEIATFARELVSAYRAGDIEKIMSAYVKDDNLVVFDVTPPIQFKGNNALYKAYADFYGAFPPPVRIDVEDFHVTVEGNIAYSYEFDTWSATGTDGKKISFKARETYIYKKIDGKWLIVHEHCSVPVDVVTGQADFGPKPQAN